MSTNSNVLHLAAQSNTLDLFTHPLTTGGLYPGYLVPGYPDLDGEEPSPNSSIEVLVHQDQAPAFTAEVSALGEAAALPHPVCDVATDHGGGTWRLIEVVGPRALILELMQVAQRHGCKRVLFPA
jgi:hypothetical protein